VKLLLKTQQEDGSWFVRTRALAFQPWFDAGFPHGHDQWVSAAGTNWATMALALALPVTHANAASLPAKTQPGLSRSSTQSHDNKHLAALITHYAPTGQ
jgi:hypothetical protein